MTMPNHIVVYGSACPACTQAKAVLDHHHIPYESRPISDLPRRHGPVRSMPQITVDDELLGGINQLLKLARMGGLEHLAAGDGELWVRVRRRLGRGYTVDLLDHLGRVQSRRHASNRAEAQQIREGLLHSPT